MTKGVQSVEEEKAKNEDQHKTLVFLLSWSMSMVLKITLALEMGVLTYLVFVPVLVVFKSVLLFCA